MYNALGNCMIYGNRPTLGLPTPEPVPDASFEHVGEENMSTGGHEIGESYQMLEDIAGDGNSHLVSGTTQCMMNTFRERTSAKGCSLSESCYNRSRLLSTRHSR